MVAIVSDMDPQQTCWWHHSGVRSQAGWKGWHPEGPGQAWESACANLKKAKYEVPHLGQSSPNHKERLGIEWLESSPEKKKLRVLENKKQYEPDMRPQPREASSSRAACKAEWAAGELEDSLCYALVWHHLHCCILICGLNIRRTCACWGKSRVGHQGDQRHGTILLPKQIKRLGPLQPGEVSGGVYNSHSITEMTTRELERSFLQGHGLKRKGEMALYWKRAGLS